MFYRACGFKYLKRIIIAMHTGKLFVAVLVLAVVMFGSVQGQSITALDANNIYESKDAELEIVLSGLTELITIDFTFSNPEVSDWVPFTANDTYDSDGIYTFTSSGISFDIAEDEYAANYKVVATVVCPEEPCSSKTAYFTVVKPQRAMIPEIHPLLVVFVAAAVLCILGKGL